MITTQYRHYTTHMCLFSSSLPLLPTTPPDGHNSISLLSISFACAWCACHNNWLLIASLLQQHNNQNTHCMRCICVWVCYVSTVNIYLVTVYYLSCHHHHHWHASPSLHCTLISSLILFHAIFCVSFVCCVQYACIWHASHRIFNESNSSFSFLSSSTHTVRYGEHSACLLCCERHHYAE